MDDQTTESAISRRKALKRGVIVGAAVWAPPVVSSLRLRAAAQVGSPPPTPSPSESPTPPPEEATPTPTPAPTASPTTEVGGVKHVSDADVAGEGLAKTGQELRAPTFVGAAVTAIGAGMRAAARKRAAADTDAGRPPRDEG